MEFNVEERLTMLGLLPAEDKLITMRIIHDLRQGLAFNEAELALLNFQQSDGRLGWNSSIKRNAIDISDSAITEEQTLRVEILPNDEGNPEEILIIGPKTIKVGQKAKSIIYDELEKLDNDGKIRESHLSLVDKFEYEG